MGMKQQHARSCSYLFHFCLAIRSFCFFKRALGQVNVSNCIPHTDIQGV